MDPFFKSWESILPLGITLTQGSKKESKNDRVGKKKCCIGLVNCLPAHDKLVTLPW